MNIAQPLVIVAAHPNPELYGADRVFLETVAGLVESGHRVVATLPEDGPLLAALRAHGAEVSLQATPVLRKSALNPWGLARLAVESARAAVTGVRFLRQVRPDVVYVSTVTVPLWLVLARLVRVPSLSHVHEAEKSVSRTAKLALALPLLLANQVVANSRFSAEVLTGAIARLAGKTTVIYNGVPGPPTVTPPRPILDGALRVLYVGRLSHRKGVDTVVDALAEARRRGVDVHLDIVGAVYPGYEWYEEQLREQTVSLGVTEHVSFHGFCPDVWPFLAATDVAVVPSRVDEPFGNTAVEAILAARPLIVSDSAGLREAAAGYLTPQYVPVESPGAIADALARIAADWQRISQDAVRDAETAASRHAPALYRDRMVRALTALTGR